MILCWPAKKVPELWGFFPFTFSLASTIGNIKSDTLKPCESIVKLLITVSFAVLLPLIIIWSMSTSPKEMSLEWQLAVIDAGEQLPEYHSNVAKSLLLLDSLEKKCSNSREEIARVCLATYSFLAERGSLLTLLEFIQQINESIPEHLDSKIDIKEAARAATGYR